MSSVGAVSDSRRAGRGCPHRQEPTAAPPMPMGNIKISYKKLSKEPRISFFQSASVKAGSVVSDNLF